MSTVSLIEIESFGKKSDHTFFKNEDSNCLVVIFPGGANSCNRPILHFIRKYFLNKNCDVLCASYKNLFEREDTFDVKLDKIVSGIKKAIQKVELDKSYKDKIFISRSIGNVASCELKIRHSMNILKSVYISPTSPALKYFNDYPGFIVSSSNDEYLKADEIDKLSKLGDDKIIVFKDGNHSLETSNIKDTVEFCKEAVLKVVEFIEE